MYYINVKTGEVIHKRYFKNCGNGIYICRIKIKGIESNKPFQFLKKEGKITYVRPFDINEKVDKWKEEYLNEKGRNSKPIK